ncbi:MAG: S-layer homology domain-containing protein [Andreesenia angusta]|nr:S-layer homology domain-containing protein [Andreesenia angusta]
MKKQITSIILVSSIIFSSATAFAYSDIVGHWAENEINILSEDNIINGYMDNTFRPDNPISREEAAQIISNYTGEIIKEAPIPFDAENRWSSDAIQNLVSRGIITGYEDSSFKPEKYITRAEFAAIVNRYLKSESMLNDSYLFFDDIGYSWAQLDIASLAGNNVISGYNEKIFNPDSNITRAEAAKIINNFKNIESKGIELSVLEDALYLFEDVKDYIINGQNNLSEAQKLNWAPEFLNAITKRDFIILFEDYLLENPDLNDIPALARYMTYNAPIKPDWKEKFEKHLYENLDEVVRDYEQIDESTYRVYIIGRDTSYVVVNAITGNYHG